MSFSFDIYHCRAYLKKCAPLVLQAFGSLGTIGERFSRRHGVLLMVDVNPTAMRPDVDIENEIEDIIVHYPPLNADRHHIHLDVRNGVVSITGHTRTPINRRYLLDAIAPVEGIKSTRADRFYDEETIRLEAGRMLPPGLIVNTRYGTLILSGKVPAGTMVEDVVARASRIPGVERVITSLMP
jgi:osmotically-inducible protein OsmY